MAPICANWPRYSGRESTLAPTSRKYVGRPAVGRIVPSAGRSTPRIRPCTKSAAAMIAPELPADTHAAASPCRQSRAQTLIEESVFERTDWAGWSVISITWLAGTKRSLVWESSSRCTRTGMPTTATSRPYSWAACAAPRITCSGALSPPMPSTATGSLRWSLRTNRLDVEVAHRLGVRGDELLARLHVAAHQLLEDVVDRGSILD